MINLEEVPPKELDAAFVKLQQRFLIFREMGVLVMAEATVSGMFPQLAEDEQLQGQLTPGLRELLTFAGLLHQEFLKLASEPGTTPAAVHESELLAELSRILFAALALGDFQKLACLQGCRPEIRKNFELVAVGQNTDPFGSDTLSVLSNPPVRTGSPDLNAKPPEN